MTRNNLHLDQILVNAPVEVNFAGLRGTTSNMQREGWQLAIESNRDYRKFGYEVRLAGKHIAMDLRVVSMPTFIDESYVGQQSFSAIFRSLHFDLYICSNKINFQVLEHKMPSFKPVDFSSPVMEDFIPSRFFSLDDVCFFKPMNDEVDIYVPKDQLWTVEKHLTAIREMQKDRQKELREKARRSREKLSFGSNYQYGEDITKREIQLQLVAV